MAKSQISREKSLKRKYENHLSKGLCVTCSKPLSERSKRLCDYHLGYNVGMRVYKDKLERFLIGNMKEEK